MGFLKKIHSASFGANECVKIINQFILYFPKDFFSEGLLKVAT